MLELELRVCLAVQMPRRQLGHFAGTWEMCPLQNPADIITTKQDRAEQCKASVSNVPRFFQMCPVYPSDSQFNAGQMDSTRNTQRKPLGRDSNLQQNQFKESTEEITYCMYFWPGLNIIQNQYRVRHAAWTLQFGTHRSEAHSPYSHRVLQALGVPSAGQHNTLQNAATVRDCKQVLKSFAFKSISKYSSPIQTI